MGNQAARNSQKRSPKSNNSVNSSSSAPSRRNNTSPSLPSPSAIAAFRRALGTLTQPENYGDLAFFADGVRSILASSSGTGWLLNAPKPSALNSSSPEGAISAQYASAIMERLPYHVSDNLPDNTYELLEKLSELSLKAFAYTKNPTTPSARFPERSEAETLTEYFRRVQYWIAVYFPEANSSPPAVQMVAKLAWVSHCQIYDLQSVPQAFEDVVPKFRDINDVIIWFHTNTPLKSGPFAASSQSPLNSVVNSNVKESSTVKGSPKRSEGLKVSSVVLSGSISHVGNQSFWHQKDPDTYTEAMKMPDAALWRQALDVAMRPIGELVDAPEGVHVLSGRWVFRRELSKLGANYTARLVARDPTPQKDTGNDQSIERAYKQAYTTSAPRDMLLLVLGVTVQLDWHIEKVRVKAHSMYGEQERDIYVQQPEGYTDGTKRVYRLKKKFRQAKPYAQQWFLTILTMLQGVGFEKVSGSVGMFVCTANKKKTVALLCSRDLLIASAEKEEVARVKSLIAKTMGVVSSGFPKSYDSLRISRSPAGLALDAPKVVRKLLNDYRPSFSKYSFKKSVPILPTEARKAVRISKIQESSGPWDKSLKELAEPLPRWDGMQYRSAVGGLSYIANICRPDIAFAASQLSRYMVNPNKLHWRMLMRLLCYLESTKDAKLTFKKRNDTVVVGFADGVLGDEYVKHPHEGYAWYYRGCLFSWSSRRERKACANSEEALMRGMINALQYAEYIRYVLTTIGAMDENAKGSLYVAPKQVDVESKSAPRDRMWVLKEKVVDLAEYSRTKVHFCARVGNLGMINAFTQPLSEPEFEAAARKMVLTEKSNN